MSFLKNNDFMEFIMDIPIMIWDWYEELRLKRYLKCWGKSGNAQRCECGNNPYLAVYKHKKYNYFCTCGKRGVVPLRKLKLLYCGI